MLESKENRVRIEGILSEINIEPSTFVKDGKTNEAIGGTIKIRVEQKLMKSDANPTVLEIPVHFFATKLTKKGAPNPAYENISRIKNEYISIAASNEESADRIRITNGEIRMNEYYGQNGNLVSFPRIHASFVSKVRKEDFKPEATFSATFAVASKGYETDSEGVETDKYFVLGILPQYGGKVDIVKFYSASPNVTDAISEYWEEGDTVRAAGKLNFSSRTETSLVQVDFGDPIETTRTISVSELLITGGSSTPLEGEFAYNQDEIMEALKERKARLAEQKEQGSKKNKGANGKAPSKNPASARDKYADLGF